jgi:hypothetical protein
MFFGWALSRRVDLLSMTVGINEGREMLPFPQQCLKIFLVVTTGRGLLLASSGQRPGCYKTSHNGQDTPRKNYLA